MESMLSVVGPPAEQRCKCSLSPKSMNIIPIGKACREIFPNHDSFLLSRELGIYDTLSIRNIRTDESLADKWVDVTPKLCESSSMTWYSLTPAAIRVGFIEAT